MTDSPDMPSTVVVKQELGGRLRRVRTDLYGEDGGPELARLLGLPARTWANYEAGVTMPGEVLLALLDLTGVEPRWLLRGGSLAYRRSEPEAIGRGGSRAESSSTP
jgi:transcriptional regulator with XRE-family HTH domain